MKSPSTDCPGAHGNHEGGRCPRCRSLVRVVGFESCNCGREQIEQLEPLLEISAAMRTIGGRYKTAERCALAMAECLADGRPVEHAISRAAAFLEAAVAKARTEVKI